MSSAVGGWALKMKSFLSIQPESDSDGSISPPTSEESSGDEAKPSTETDKEFESLFPKSTEVKEALQAKVNIVPYHYSMSTGND